MVFIVIGNLACKTWYVLPVLKPGRGGVTECRTPLVNAGWKNER